MSISITPISEALGAEVRGIDASAPLDDRTRAALVEAWREYVVLLYRGQTLGEDEQTRFAGQFGSVGERARPPERRPEGADYNPSIMLVSNIRKDGVPIGSLPDGEMWFHHDMCYTEMPHHGTFLYAIEVPSVGGNTRFANMYKAYDLLPEATKRRIRGLKALHVYDYATTSRIDPDGDFSAFRHYYQPLAITHPITGRRALYVNPLMTVRIEGLPRAESDALLEELYSFTTNDALIYEHEWRVGDFLMWDNWCSCHARTDFPETERRLLRRCTILGQKLFETAEAAA